MIEKVYWPMNSSDLSLREQVEGKFSSPFEKNMRPLKITIHNSGLDNLPKDESEALNIILEISKHKFIEIIQTEEGENPHDCVSVFL